MNWLLGVVGVVLMGLAVDVLLPQGQMSKYVKGVFAVLLMFVLLDPVAAFFRQNTSIDDLLDFDVGRYETDDAYIDLIETERMSAALAEVRARYRAVYDLKVDGEGNVLVYVQGEAPAGLGEYVCIVTSASPEEVIIYESG